PVMAQRLRDPIPVAAMVASAMHEEQRRRGGVAPIDVMQPQPLRKINARGWAVAVFFVGCCHRRRLGLFGWRWGSLYDKTPARIRASRGSAVRSNSSLPAAMPGYILDLALRCRCQGVGNLRAPGGLMSANTLLSGLPGSPPVSPGRHPSGRHVDDTLHLGL